MIRYITRTDLNLLEKGETKTVTLFDEKERELWADYMEHMGGAVCVQVREISDMERKMIEGHRLTADELDRLVHGIQA